MNKITVFFTYEKCTSLKKNFNLKHLNPEIEDQAADRPYNIGVENFVNDENNSQRWSWKFGNSPT